MNTRVRELSRLNPVLSFATILFDWMVILSAIWLVSQDFGVVVKILAFLVIASRQHGLLLMMHEAAHLHLSRHQRVNDLVSDLFCAYPFFMRTEKYRSTHLPHHLHLGTAQDPDWVLVKDQKAWQFPKAKKEIYQILGIRFFAGDLLLFLKKHANFHFFRKPGAFIYWALILSAVIYFKLTSLFLLYWILPILTVLSVSLRIRAIAEHSGLPGQSELKQSRNVKTHLLEEFFLSPHNGNYHLDHHLYPSVPFYNLKKLHRSLMRTEVYQAQAAITPSYFGGKKSLIHELSQQKN